jgi:hypothetical protein
LKSCAATSSAVGESWRGAEGCARGIALTADDTESESKIEPCSGLVMVNTFVAPGLPERCAPDHGSAPQHSEQSSKIGYVN